MAEGRVALATFHYDCPPGDEASMETCGRYMGQEPARFAFAAGPLGGPLSAVTGSAARSARS